jgi:competence protein ComGC
MCIKTKKWVAFSLVEMLLALGITTILIGLSIPMILSNAQQTQGDQNKAKVQQLKNALANTMNSLRMEQDVNALSNASFMQRMKYTQLKTSASLSLDLSPRDESGTAAASGGSSTHNFTATEPAYYLPFGGVLLDFPQNLATNCSTVEENMKAFRFYYDPDARASGNNDTVYLYIYLNGDVRTLETIKPHTCTAVTATQARITGSDPSYL